jgi:hypothetical protein
MVHRHLDHGGHEQRMGDPAALDGVEDEFGIERRHDRVRVALEPVRHGQAHVGEVEHRRGMEVDAARRASPSASSARPELHMLVWLSITPLGKPVVPPV